MGMLVVMFVVCCIGGSGLFCGRVAGGGGAGSRGGAGAGARAGTLRRGFRRRHVGRGRERLLVVMGVVGRRRGLDFWQCWVRKCGMGEGRLGRWWRWR